MANWAKNMLQVSADTEKNVVDAFFASIAGKIEIAGKEIDIPIDFQKIIPAADQYEGLIAWGTKCCYSFGQNKLDEYTITFLTAWKSVPKLMLELSRQHPEVKLCYICDLGYDNGYSIGVYTLHGGEVLSESYHERGTESYDKYMLDLCRSSPEGENRDIEIEKALAEERKIKHEAAERALEELARSNPIPSDIPLEKLNLSVGTYHCLKRAKVKSVGIYPRLIKTVEDLIGLSKQDLMQDHNLQVRGFNKKHLDEVSERLKILNLTLRDK